MRQDPPAARGAVEGSTDTRSLEWFLSQSSAILREGEECPQHGLRKPNLLFGGCGVLIYASPSHSSSWTEARHEHSKWGFRELGCGTGCSGPCCDGSYRPRPRSRAPPPRNRSCSPQ